MAWYQHYSEDAEYHAKFRVAFHKFRNAFDDPEDAFQTALYRLFYEKLPGNEPSHRQNLDAFVMGVFRNIVRDMIREIRGRPRPTAEMVRDGVADIHQKYVIEGKPIDVIAEELDLPVASVRPWVAKLKAAEGKPSRPVFVSMAGVDPDEPLREQEYSLDARVDSVGGDVAIEESANIAQRLFAQTTENAEGYLSQAADKQVSAMREGLSLSDEESLIVRLVYDEGLSLAATARALGIAVHTCRRRHDALLLRLRAFFEEYQLDV